MPRYGASMPCARPLKVRRAGVVTGRLASLRLTEVLLATDDIVITNLPLWQWTHDDDNVASIDLRAETDRLHLSYRVRIAAATGKMCPRSRKMRFLEWLRPGRAGMHHKRWSGKVPSRATGLSKLSVQVPPHWWADMLVRDPDELEGSEEPATAHV